MAEMPPSPAAVAAAEVLRFGNDQSHQSFHVSWGGLDYSHHTCSKHSLRSFSKRSAVETLSGVATSLFVESDLLKDVPRFTSRELRLGEVLGKGSFGVVREVIGADISFAGGSGHRNSGLDEFGNESRRFIARHCIREKKRKTKRYPAGRLWRKKDPEGGDARYAVKFLRQEIRDDPDALVRGIADMHIETRILASVEHPNIVKMRAFADGDPHDPGYFILIDRLYDTLSARLQQWVKKDRRHKSLMGSQWFNRGKKKARSLMEDRLIAAFDLSAALEYLHSRNIVYRDLKPQNVAFDIRGDIKLFDFGLSKELDPLEMDDLGNYEPSGICGSLRYMAPEVARGDRYNLAVDTYSFSILLWEMLALKKPFLGLGTEAHRVLVGEGEERPPLDGSWPQSLRSLMQRGWSHDIAARPPMSSVTTILRNELTRMRDGGVADMLGHEWRRSTFVLRKKISGTIGGSLKSLTSSFKKQPDSTENGGATSESLSILADSKKVPHKLEGGHLPMKSVYVAATA